ncbi:MAG TPA: kelch repeat-containing protein [Candidatus Limnocylindrales bacterium]|nr:kelch repeat-containing protein [Candidatus Limnocylindrales bacterium]
MSATLAPSATPSPAPVAAATWRPAGKMVSPHSHHTATLLPDGRVLVAGGLINDRLDGRASALAELYDPDRGTWSATGQMRGARWGQTATLLANGKVLVAGGFDDARRPLDTAELYDPDNGRWASTGRLTTGRGGHAATPLASGKVLVTGGGEEDTTTDLVRSASAEVYDPADGTWAKIRQMVEARGGHTATPLSDGTVLVAGGGSAAAERYDPGTGRWTATGNMTESRWGHSATLLPDGTVLVTGGCACSDPGAWKTAELYQPDSGTWIVTEPMSKERIFHSAVPLTGGPVLVVGQGGRENPHVSAELYGPDRGQWDTTAKPAHTREGATATMLSNGMVLLVGDYDGDRSAELYDPGSGM